MEILVNHLTRMHGGNICVAGIEVDTRRRKYREVSGSLWLDECQFSWSIGLAFGEDRRAEPRARSSLRLEKTVTYVDVKADGRAKHWAMVVVPPHVLRRYAPRIADDRVFTGLKIKVGGKTREAMWARGGRLAKERDMVASRVNWLESEEIPKLAHGLMAKRDSPWQHSSLESFELSKPDAK